MGDEPTNDVPMTDDRAGALGQFLANRLDGRDAASLDLEHQLAAGDAGDASERVEAAPGFADAECVERLAGPIAVIDFVEPLVDLNGKLASLGEGSRGLTRTGERARDDGAQLD